MSAKSADEFRDAVVQVRADSAKVESDIAGVKADIARVETKLEVFREFVNDRFDRMEARIETTSGFLLNKIPMYDQKKNLSQ